MSTTVKSSEYEDLVAKKNKYKDIAMKYKASSQTKDATISELSKKIEDLKSKLAKPSIPVQSVPVIKKKTLILKKPKLN